MRKRILVSILLTLGILGCNKKTSDTKQLDVNKKNTLDNCIGLKDYRAVLTNNQKAKWLKENGHLVCKDTLYKEMFKEHVLSSAEYDRYKKEFGDQVSLKINWNSIKDTIKNHFYDKYLGFSIKGNKITSINLIPDYLEKGGSYSIPLFLGIADSLKLKDDDTATEFEFIQTKEALSPIIFKVTNTSSGFEMNYSTKPLKK